MYVSNGLTIGSYHIHNFYTYKTCILIWISVFFLLGITKSKVTDGLEKHMEYEWAPQIYFISCIYGMRASQLRYFLLLKYLVNRIDDWKKGYVTHSILLNYIDSSYNLNSRQGYDILTDYYHITIFYDLHL